MIPIYKPYMPEGLGPEIERILYSGNLVSGFYRNLFEKSLGAFLGNSKVLVTSSYNVAMLIALSTIGVKAGDEVIASPVSCLASNQPVVSKGAKIIWADVDPKTGALNVEDVKRKVTSKTKAIIHNHFCGYVGDVNSINSLATEIGIYVIDDAIEAFGSEYEGKKVGALNTDVTVFSFQTVRIPNTIDGGAVSFNNEELKSKALKIRDYGINRPTFRLDNGEINPDSDVSLEGYAGSMSEVNAYIGLKQMDDLKLLLKKQQTNALVWDTKIQHTASLEPLVLSENTKPNYWVYGLLAKNKEKAIIDFRNEGYYATGVHLNNDHYSLFGRQKKLLGVEEFMDSYIALPSGWWVNKIE